MVIIQGIFITVISAFIIWLISSGYKKYNQKRNQELFIIKDPKIIQKANHQCITVRFKSNNAVLEFQRRNGQLVGIDGLDGWVRQDCPILQEHMNSWSFKLKRFFRLKFK